MSVITAIIIVVLIACLYFKSKEWLEVLTKEKIKKLRGINPQYRYNTLRRKYITKSKYVKRFR